MATKHHYFEHDGVSVKIEIKDHVVNYVEIPKLPESHFNSSDWDCPDSITKKCVYTDYIGFDCCIFCGDPEERK